MEIFKTIISAVSCLFFFITSYLPVAAQTTLTLQPNSTDGKDAVLSSYDATSNLGSHVQVYPAAWTISGNPDNVRSLIAFDLSSIPTNAVIISANLTLYANTTSILGGHSGTANSSFLQKVTSTWDENTVTWNTQPSVTTTNQITLPQSTAEFEDYNNIDVSVIVQDMVTNPSSNFGFMIRLQSETTYNRLVFASSDHADPALHPKLEISYSIPTGIVKYGESEAAVKIFPNPFSERTDINFSIKEQSDVLIDVYSLNGEKITNVVSDHLSIGDYSYKLNLKDSENIAGVYILNIRIGNATFIKRLVVI